METQQALALVTALCSEQGDVHLIFDPYFVPFSLSVFEKCLPFYSVFGMEQGHILPFLYIHLNKL